MIWFTSDTHFGHANIIRLCSRPFASIDEMNEALIANWNERIDSDDTVYHLGDFAYKCSTQQIDCIFGRLNGSIHLVPGGHDGSKGPRNSERLTTAKVEPLLTVKPDEKRHCVLCHYPLLSWWNMRRGVVHLHGHSHSREPMRDPTVARIDVGVDAWGFRPVSWDEVKSLFVASRESK